MPGNLGRPYRHDHRPEAGREEAPLGSRDRDVHNISPVQQWWQATVHCPRVVAV